MTALPDLLAGLGIATSRTTVMGHSAGGHLALWLANQPHHLDRVVALAPVGDLRAAARDHLGDDATQAFLGGEPADVPERYDAADPAARLAVRPSCEVVVVHGVDDDVVPVANSRGLVARHPFVTLHELEGADHFDVIDPLSGAWPAVRDAVVSGSD
jgi:dipeptidyl aminopeptidase/acylaminoacyl peptidase